MAGSGIENATDIDNLRRKRDEFVASMAVLRYTTEEVSRTGLALFNNLIGSREEQQQQPQALLQPGTAKEPKGPKERAKRKKRDPEMPKRPMGAYFLFCSQRRDAIKADLGPNATRNDIKVELAKRWSDIPKDQKETWEDIAAKNRQVYEKDMATYKATKSLQTAESSIGFTTVDSELDNFQEPEAESDMAESTAGSEQDEEVEEDVGSPTPHTSHKRAKTQPKKAVAPNYNPKKALNSIAISGTSTAATPAVVNLRAGAEPTMRKRARRKRVVEAQEEEASDEATPKNKATHKRRKNSD
ncbi:hypothetical protein HOY82DRAFT_479817 [Tuber indicum]|nr:hypothetical protein HOY82DRAFT_479817 [Tuber indicum]